MTLKTLSRPSHPGNQQSGRQHDLTAWQFPRVIRSGPQLASARPGPQRRGHPEDRSVQPSHRVHDLGIYRIRSTSRVPTVEVKLDRAPPRFGPPVEPGGSACRDRGAPASTSESPANAPSAPLKTAPHAMTGPAADVPSTMTVAASCVREVTPSFR